MTDLHEHTWIPDGESWSETEHHDSCDVPDADTGRQTLKAIRKCECETFRVRRFTCHCGEMKEVRYE